jgi:hypothetical protein
VRRCVIYKPQGRGGNDPRWVAAQQQKKTYKGVVCDLETPRMRRP